MEEHGEPGIEEDQSEKNRDNRSRGAVAYSLGAPGGRETLLARDESDREPKDYALDDSGKNLPHATPLSRYRDASEIRNVDVGAQLLQFDHAFVGHDEAD